MMNKSLLFLFTLLSSPLAQASLVQLFKDEQGKTNWQYVANWSSGILIIILSIVITTLFFTWLKARRYNRELEAIRSDLEQRVEERTATLKESNQLLEEEIAQHVITTNLLRSSESYIRSILKSMPLMLIGLNKAGQITQWNQRAEDISGIPADAALGRNLWDTYPGITVSPNQIDRARELNETINIKQSQSGLYYFDITIYPLQDQTETGVVILIDDVTRKTLADNMLIHNDKLSSMGELAATMAHDINTPLQAILFDLNSYQNQLRKSAVLRDGTQNNPELDRLSNLLTDASEKGRHVASIINNLLSFARGRTDKKQPALMSDIMEHALGLARDVLSSHERLKFRDIRIERDYEANLPSINCYVVELQQVFLNLFRHAYDALLSTAHPDREPVIHIQLSECYDALWIKIQHNGKGLTSEEQMYLFEPFFSNQPDGDDYDAGKRLSFCYFVITEQHQGHMAVTSDVDVGTTFHMQLDLK